DDRRTELPLVYKVVGEFVIRVDPGLEPGQNDLTGSDIEVVVALRLRSGALSDLRCGCRVGEEIDARLCDEFERRRHKIARITDGEGGRFGRLPNGIDARA